jgi:hypothetical protein
MCTLFYYLDFSANFYFTTFLNKIMHFLLHTLHFECLSGQENDLIKRTSLVIPAASDLADSLNTHASLVNDV